jgi:hypothetical protein
MQWNAEANAASTGTPWLPLAVDARTQNVKTSASTRLRSIIFTAS